MEIGINTKGWTAIDCGDAPSLCAVSLKTGLSGRSLPQVLAVAEVPGPGADADPAVEAAALRALLGPLDRRLAALVTLPRSRYRLRVMPEPAVLPREMSSTLRWTLSSEGDGSEEESNLVWMRIPTDEQLPGRPRQLYAVTTPSAWLQARLGSWRQAGLKPKVVDIRETALRNIAARLERPGEGLALLSLDHEGVGMVFTHQGSLFLDRFIEQPLAELRAADAAARTRLHARVAEQLLRSVDYIARTWPFMLVSRVVVAPEPEPLGLTEYLQAELPLQVEPLELGSLFDLARVPALAQSAGLQARCLVPLGAALRSARALQ